MESNPAFSFYKDGIGFKSSKVKNNLSWWFLYMKMIGICRYSDKI